MGEEGEPIEVTYALFESAITPPPPRHLVLSARLSLPTCSVRTPNMGSDEWWMTPRRPTPPASPTRTCSWRPPSSDGATDKSNPLSLDEIINLNTYLGLNSYTFVEGEEGAHPDRLLLRLHGLRLDQRLTRSPRTPPGSSWSIAAPRPAPARTATFLRLERRLLGLHGRRRSGRGQPAGLS